MAIYDGEDDGNDFDDDFMTGLDTSTNHSDGSNHVTKRQTPPPSLPRESPNKPERNSEEDNRIKEELVRELGISTKRSASVTPPPVSQSRSTVHSMGHSAPPLNVPSSRRYNRDGLLDYRLLDAARMEERFVINQSINKSSFC